MNELVQIGIEGFEINRLGILSQLVRHLDDIGLAIVDDGLIVDLLSRTVFAGEKQLVLGARNQPEKRTEK